jgi:phosphoglucomutase
MKIDSRAGQLASEGELTDVGGLITAYEQCQPDPLVPSQRVTFGTSGHRGSAFDRSFNRDHVLAITQAICEYRVTAGITGPLFLGIDTHALSIPACRTALEVLAAHDVEVMITQDYAPTPTPTISHAILTYNRGRKTRLADGIVITPSHNPPDSGGYKYNPPHGGPADSNVTAGIQNRANQLLDSGLTEVDRVTLAKALAAPTTRHHDYMEHYVNDLGSVLDMEKIAAAGVRIGVDPLGGAGVHYWDRIAQRYALDITVLNREIDPQFGFMTRDWDGAIRMDPSSGYAMKNLVAQKDRFDVAFACDTDHDRHGIVVPSTGLMPANHYLAVAIDYLFVHRQSWPQGAGIGKTVVSSALIDRVAKGLNRQLIETPVGFKWFVDGLQDGSMGFAGEESAGASFLRRDGSVWTTDKDGITAALLSAEILAVTGDDPGLRYGYLTEKYGKPYADRVEAAATTEQKSRLSALTPDKIHGKMLAGEVITGVTNRAPGNNAPIGGLKVETENGWFAARPSGTEDIYKIYAESFRDENHLRDIIVEAQAMVDTALDA